MNVLFVHDHKFREINGAYYSPGGLSNDILSRYTSWFDKVEVIGRIIIEENVKDNYSKITNNRIQIIPKEMLKKKVQNTDAVIARLPSINGYKAVIWAKFYKKPCLVEVVGCTFDAYWHYNFFGKIVALPAYAIMHWCIENASQVLYVTNSFLQKRYPTRCFQAGISDLTLISADSIVLKNRIDRIQSNKNKFIIGTTAAIDVPYKGQRYVIKALPKLEAILGIPVEYQLAGAGDNSKLIMLAKEVGVESKVIFKGLIPHENIFDWLDQLDMYVHPSMLEGLSRAIMEAMSRGLPCIAADRGGNSELLPKECLFDIHSEKRIEDSIVQKMADIVCKNKEKECAIKNYTFINENFSNESLIKKRNEFYLSFRDRVKI